MAYGDNITITHTQARVKPRNTYNHTYIKFLPGQNNIKLYPDKTTYTLFTPDPTEYKCISGPKINNNALTTHGNAPKGSAPYLRPKLHIQHTYSQHLSTSTQVTTNDKSTYHNKMSGVCTTFGAIEKMCCM